MEIALLLPGAGAHPLSTRAAALEILNRGVFLPQFVDSPFQRNVLLEQSLRMGFQLRVNLL